MQLQEAHRHRQLNGQECQGLQTRFSRCFFLTRDQDRWTFQLFTRARTPSLSVGTETEQCVADSTHKCNRVVETKNSSVKIFIVRGVR